MLFLEPQLQNDDAIFNSSSPKLVEHHEPGIIYAGYSIAPSGYTCILEGPTRSAIPHWGNIWRNIGALGMWGVNIFA